VVDAGGGGIAKRRMKRLFRWPPQLAEVAFDFVE
jgi:hypothetical protein